MKYVYYATPPTLYTTLRYVVYTRTGQLHGVFELSFHPLDGLDVLKEEGVDALLSQLHGARYTHSMISSLYSFVPAAQYTIQNDSIR